jgi:hypothetical protein
LKDLHHQVLLEKKVFVSLIQLVEFVEDRLTAREAHICQLKYCWSFSVSDGDDGDDHMEGSR